MHKEIVHGEILSKHSCLVEVVASFFLSHFVDPPPAALNHSPLCLKFSKDCPAHRMLHSSEIYVEAHGVVKPVNNFTRIFLVGILHEHVCASSPLRVSSLDSQVVEVSQLFFFFFLDICC